MLLGLGMMRTQGLGLTPVSLQKGVGSQLEELCEALNPQMMMRHKLQGFECAFQIKNQESGPLTQESLQNGLSAS